ncbi:MAG: glutathione S-transferase C-terminal domain-containing protein, partial [Candidatus Saccharibacteria bacterium]|nr:glutathione S-transferase C-terminal domain-containing protein [Rhodoferax sp.]
VTLGWPAIVQMMIKGMDLGRKQGAESRAILDQELAWLDALLADGRPYLTGPTWTRADLTAASLLAPLVAPQEHPVVQALEFPAIVASAMKEWAQRPSLQFVNRAYALHRKATP